jgi:glycerophosphoryl diester phosphodiesterase
MKSSWKRLLSLGAVAVALAAGMNQIPAQAKVNIGAFDLEAHRGGRDARPENTLYSEAYGMQVGVTTIELDMQMTKDGHLVISHNPVMNPNITKGPDGQYVPGSKYDLRTMTLDEIKKFEIGVMDPKCGDYWEGHGKTQLQIPGVRFCTLEDEFELARTYGNDRILWNIETKSYPAPTEGFINNPDPAAFAKKVYEVVKKYHMEDRVMLQSFDWRTLVEMRKLDPRITLVALCNEQPSWGPDPYNTTLELSRPGASRWLAGIDIHDFNGDFVAAAHLIGADVISPYYQELSLQLIEEAHGYGMKVIPWTVNSKKAMETLLGMGVDGIISDKPVLLREVLKSHNIPVPDPTPAPKGDKYDTGTAYGGDTGKELAHGLDAAS